MTPAPHVNDRKAAGKIAADLGVLSRYSLIFFFIIACAGSWLVVLPYLRSASGAGLLPFAWPVPFAVSAALAPFAGPFLAAFVMTCLTEGTPGIRRLLGRFVQWSRRVLVVSVRSRRPSRHPGARRHCPARRPCVLHGASSPAAADLSHRFGQSVGHWRPSRRRARKARV